jgi:putative spermidine/putrescine transport system permease protein
MGVFFLLPVGSLLSFSVFDQNNELTAAHYRQALSSDIYITVILYTLQVSFVVTLICLVIAYPICVYIASVPPLRQRKLLIWILIPFWTSFLIRTFAWIIILGRNGLINSLLMDAGLTDQPFKLIYNSIGLGVGLVHALLPLTILTMLPVILAINPDLARASSVLGASGSQAFWRIYFPLSFPGIAAAGVLTFVTALGFFITPALLGGASQTMVSQVIIRQVQELLNWSLAGAISVLLLSATLIVLFVYGRIFGLSTLIGGSPASNKKSATSAIGTNASVKVLGAFGNLSDWIGRSFGLDRVLHMFGCSMLAAFAWLSLAFLMLPSLALVPVSVTSSSLLGWPPKGFSLRWFEQLWRDGQWTDSAVASLIIGVAVGLLSVAIGTAAAFAIVRSNFRGKGLLLSIAVAPLIIPRIIIAVALMYFMAKLRLIDTYTGMILGHAVLAVPYVLITVISVLRDYHIAFDHAAWTLGASRAMAFRKVTFPLIRPALITAFVFAFITSFDDVTISLFLSGSDVVTLPKRMWLDAFLDVTPVLAAVSTILIAVIFGLLGIAEVLRIRHERPRGAS